MIRAGLRVLIGSAFWRDVLKYYSPGAISERLDRLAERLRRS